MLQVTTIQIYNYEWIWNKESHKQLVATCSGLWPSGGNGQQLLASRKPAGEICETRDAGSFQPIQRRVVGQQCNLVTSPEKMCVFLVVDFRKVSEQLNNDFELTERDCNCRCGSISPGNTCNTSETHVKHSFSSVNGMPFVHILHIQQCMYMVVSWVMGGFPSSHHFSWDFPWNKPRIFG